VLALVNTLAVACYRHNPPAFPLAICALLHIPDKLDGWGYPTCFVYSRDNVGTF
jgi:hypothetical protein